MEAQVKIEDEFVGGSADRMLEWCRSAEARQGWPGAGDVISREDHLFFGLSLRSPGAPHAEVRAEEQLGEVQTDAQGWRFTSTQRWLWPSGEVASAWVQYELSTKAEGVKEQLAAESSALKAPEAKMYRLQVTLRYQLPGGSFAKSINQMRFSRAVEEAMRRYVSSLILASGSETAQRLGQQR